VYAGEEEAASESAGVEALFKSGRPPRPRPPWPGQMGRTNHVGRRESGPRTRVAPGIRDPDRAARDAGAVRNVACIPRTAARHVNRRNRHEILCRAVTAE
jgi:hypothetical protein